MKRFFILLTSIYLVSCNPEGNNQTNDPTTNPDTEVKNYYNLTEKIPINKFPSVLFKGKLFDPCNKGESFFLDICWEKIVVNLDDQSVKFFKGENELEIGFQKKSLKEWYENLERRDNTNVFDRLIQSFNCLDRYEYEEPCRLAAISEITNEIKEGEPDIEYLVDGRIHLDTYFGITEVAGEAIHNWASNGEIVMEGNTYQLPIQKKLIEEIYPKAEGSINEFRISKNFVINVLQQNNRVGLIDLYYEEE